MKYFGKLLQKPGLVDSYRELDNEKDILEALADYISPNVKDMKSMTDMTDFVKAFGLKVFASFKTTRTKYRLDGVSVDLDVASFGYSVGEIEIVVESEEEIPDAEAKLENLAKKLGINWKASYPGKLEEYLRLHNLSLYREFVAKGVLRNHSAL
ncbi:hypothetical protein QZH41_010422 [Actinostola sp. cb2023]|nr:hypothetical protein QZH41_010422 [Actinostola sp. cb2023]